MKKLLIVLLLLLSGCSSKDEYGVDASKYSNIIHCEISTYEDGYSNTIIEQIYGNYGVVEYLYSEQLMIFEEKSLVNNTKEEKEAFEGFELNVKVDKKNGVVDTITRIDYLKLDFQNYIRNYYEGEYSDEEIIEIEMMAKDIGAIDMTYCEVVK